jgi:glutathione S-transferase
MNLESGLLGKTKFGHAKIDEWITWSQTALLRNMFPCVEMIFGNTKMDDEKMAANLKQLQDSGRVLNKYLEGKDWIADNMFTLADMYVGCMMMQAFQVLLDHKYRKSVPNLTKWFDKVCLEPRIQHRFGVVQPCENCLA